MHDDAEADDQQRVAERTEAVYPDPVRTKSAGSVVESSVPKNGTIATRPVKIPNGSAERHVEHAAAR